MQDELSRNKNTLILGRPFLMKTKTFINVYNGTLTMEFGNSLN